MLEEVSRGQMGSLKLTRGPEPGCVDDVRWHVIVVAAAARGRQWNDAPGHCPGLGSAVLF